jgi:hypothetical protein
VKSKKIQWEKVMKKSQKKKQQSVGTAGSRMNAKERKAFQAAWKQVNELSDRLGLFDPMDGESPMIFFAEERKR